ncbi:MAG: U32 family peptidase [Lachnospiraceae bacterium]|nr:U32 family peptidase [Lachnospiraceae bacterium]
MRETKKIELLSPAGDMECMTAAFKAGADAVYLGGNKFGARAYASNFSSEELLCALDHAHLRGKKIYLTVNTLLKNNEIEELYDYISPLYENGLDGVIVQDIGVIDILSEFFPDLSLHASTQMAITDSEGVMLLKSLGISRVVPARELSIKEIKDIIGKTGMELECFIHGALCYSYSGKCLFSSFVGGRSGNRGRCAQPCRLPYDNKYLLSARDICTIEIIPELILAGISSFKIEGRMKSREYVAGVTGIYRKYIDKFYNDQDNEYVVDKGDMQILTQMYTRSGHCQGYYHLRNGKELITLNKPSYNTVDPLAAAKVYEKYTDINDKLPVKGIFTAFAGQPLTFTVEYKEYSVTYSGQTVDEADNNPVNEENIRKHLSKSGDSDYYFEDIDIYIGDNIFMPVSALKKARREALKELTGEILNNGISESENNYSINKDRMFIKKDKITSLNSKDNWKMNINCYINKLYMFNTVIEYDFIDVITIDINEFTEVLTGEEHRSYVDINKLKSRYDKIRCSGRKMYLSFPDIIRNDYFSRVEGIDKILSAELSDGCVIDNYESLYYLIKNGYKGRILSDIHLYALNNRSVNIYKNLGVDIITYPLELNSGELNDLLIDNGEMILYGYMPMMISAGCIKKTTGKCVKDNGISYFKDRYNNTFAAVRNCNECYNTILNCVPHMISLKEIPKKVRPVLGRIHFTIEDLSSIVKVLDYYRDSLSGKEISKPDIDFTKGHLKRGVE